MGCTTSQPAAAGGHAPSGGHSPAGGHGPAGGHSPAGGQSPAGNSTHAASGGGGGGGGGGGVGSGGGGGNSASRDATFSQQSMAYKLTYFNIQGRAEVARYLFALSGGMWEDNRVERENWPSMKESTPYGQLPVLTFNGEEYCQSDAIIRFLARQFKLYGKSEVDGLKIDEILGVISDIFTEMVKAMFMPDGDEKNKAMQTLMNESTPKFLNFLKKKLGSNKWFVGNEMTLADVAVFAILSGPMSSQGDGWTAMFPTLADVMNRIGDMQQIKDYKAKRPVTQY